jgi:D-glycero-alpha-D-manno-heptose-7-phosphate kinase
MIITRTPLRISFLGGGTDYPEYFETHGGAVLGTAVDKSAYFSLSRFYSKMFEYSIRIAYRKVECVNSIDELEHVPFRECLRYAGLTHDIEINHSAELPSMTGLGSSSSFVVGLLNTSYAFQHRLVHGLELAYQAIDLERRVLKESVGCQDQTFAAVGGFNLIEFRSMGNFSVHRLPLSPARMQDIQDHLLVFYTGIRRRAEELAGKQVKKVNVNLERLAAMRRMVDDGYRILTGGGSLADFGRLLHQSWMAKRGLDGSVSNSVIDETYDAGIEAGALGGKLLGAGGGGFIAFFVPPERQAAVRAVMSHLQEVEFQINAPGSLIIHCETEPARTMGRQMREAA